MKQINLDSRHFFATGLRRLSLKVPWDAGGEEEEEERKRILSLAKQEEKV